MKVYVLICCWVLLCSIAAAQKIEPFKGIDNNARLKIIQRVNVLQNVIQKSDTTLLSDYLSAAFKSGNEKNSLPTVALMHLPKAHLTITDVAIRGDQINVTLSLSSFMTLVVALDKDYQFKAITIGENKQEDFREIEPAFEAAKIILPFHLRDGFILIDGKVNNKKGKFMFDTGTPFAFILNGDYLGFNNSRLVTAGNAGSGQGVSLYNEDSLTDLEIADQYEKTDLKNILYSHFSFITPAVGEDFLGFMGYEFFKNYAFSIDYQQQIISLYRLDQNGASNLPWTDMKRDTVATLHFTTEEKQTPTIALRVGNNKIDGKFDTGNQGEIDLTAQTKKDLEDEHLLVAINKGYNFGFVSDGTSNYRLKSFHCEGYPFTLPFTRLQSGEVDQFGLGYSFLNQFVSVWNFKKKTIILLRN